MKECKTLEQVLNDCSCKKTRVVDQNNFSIGYVDNIKSKENVIKVYGHLEVIRIGTFEDKTAIQVMR